MSDVLLRQKCPELHALKKETCSEISFQWNINALFHISHSAFWPSFNNKISISLVKHEQESGQQSNLVEFTTDSMSMQDLEKKVLILNTWFINLVTESGIIR